MTEPTPDGETVPPPLALRVRLPGFIKDEEIGLGEVVKRATYRTRFQAVRRLRGAGGDAQPVDGLYAIMRWETVEGGVRCRNTNQSIFRPRRRPWTPQPRCRL